MQASPMAVLAGWMEKPYLLSCVGTSLSRM